MCELRRDKVRRIADTLPPSEVVGTDKGLLVLGWGSTFGAIRTAVVEANEEGMQVAHLHLRHLNPFPPDLGEIMARYDQVLIPELNLGQLSMLIRSEFLIDAIPMTKVQGLPFGTAEIKARLAELCA
jgi:2-oxoglutarate ferredoxin oxidoreductase subunit alpha